jgi:hypothetical protein
MLIRDMVALGRRISDEERATIPTDASERFDDYLEEIVN